MVSSKLSPFFALLLLMAHLHCVVSHGDVIVDQPNSAPGSVLISRDSGVPQPTRPAEPHHCEGTGCICQGATLIVSFDWQPDQAECYSWLALLGECRWELTVDSLADQQFSNSAGLPEPTPPSTRLRCALNQRFLL